MGEAISSFADLTATTRGEFLSELCGTIDTASRVALRSDSPSLDINESNRETMLRMLEMEGLPLDSDGPIDTSSARLLASSLDSYLKEYMADRPKAHQWIVLACLFLSFIAEEPMHPQGSANWEEVAPGVYKCAYREDVPGSLCHWCVCEPAS